MLEREPTRIDLRVLSRFPELDAFRARGSHGDSAGVPNASEAVASAAESEGTPEETIVAAYNQIRSAVAEDLRNRISLWGPAFFEQLVLDVLHAMGYGGRRRDATERLGRTGDEGLDGVIREDKLGLDVIYVQAKRWQASVGRPVIQAFVGALQGARASKGVMITTSTFTPEAQRYAEGVSPRVILVDGRELAELMLDHNVGVSTATSYHVKTVDEDYFADAGLDEGRSGPAE